MLLTNDGHVITGGKEGIYVFDNEGNLVWSNNSKEYEIIVPTSITSDGEYIVAFAMLRGYIPYICIFDKKGDLLWKEECASLIFPAIAPNGAYIVVPNFNLNQKPLNDYPIEVRFSFYDTHGNLILRTPVVYVNWEREAFGSVSISPDGEHIAMGCHNKKYLFNAKKLVDIINQMNSIESQINQYELKGVNLEIAKDYLNRAKTELRNGNYDKALEYLQKSFSNFSNCGPSVNILCVSVFFTIFLSSSAVLLFGLFYVAIYTLIKMGYLKSIFMPFGYIFWGLQTYCLYYVMNALGSDPYTIKVLMIAMFGYLVLPHLWYYLNQRADERYEQDD